MLCYDELLFTSICIIIYTICVNGCGIVLGILFLFSFLFFLVGGGFRAVQAPFWGNQWWDAGCVRVGHENLLQKGNVPFHFFSLCVYLCMVTCACVFVYVVSVYFFYCCFVYSFNVLLFLYLQSIYLMCKYVFQIQKIKQINNFKKNTK